MKEITEKDKAETIPIHEYFSYKLIHESNIQEVIKKYEGEEMMRLKISIICLAIGSFSLGLGVCLFANLLGFWK